MVLKCRCDVNLLTPNLVCSLHGLQQSFLLGPQLRKTVKTNALAAKHNLLGNPQGIQLSFFDNANTPKVFNPQGSKHLQFFASPIVFVFLEYHLYQKAFSKPTSFRHNSNNNTNKEPGDTMMRRPAVATSQESPQSWISSEFQSLHR